MERKIFGRAAVAALSLGVCALVSYGSAEPAAKAAPHRAIAARRGVRPVASGGPAAVVAVSPTLRLQEDLASLGYLPVRWNGQSFYYAAADVPPQIASLFQPGVDTQLLRSALMTFAADHGLLATGSATPALWRALGGDLAAGRTDPHAFTYVYVSTASPERISVWSPSGVLSESLTNTGVAGAATPDGTYPVYLRLTYQVMRGKSLNGTPYADPVHWISYFHGGDAVHGFVRQSYGYPQSLGCVEVPTGVAQRIFDELQIGTLVTVSTAPFSLTPAPEPTASSTAASLARRVAAVR